MAFLQRAVGALDSFQQSRVWLAFPIAVFRKFSNDQGPARAVPERPHYPHAANRSIVPASVASASEGSTRSARPRSR